MAIRVKKLPDDDLYELLHMSGVEELKIPRKRKDRIAAAKRFSNCFREVTGNV